MTVGHQPLFIAVCSGGNCRHNSPLMLQTGPWPDVAGTAGVCRPATQQALSVKQSDTPVALLGSDRLVLIPVLSTSRYGIQ